MLERREFYYPSSDGVHKVHAVLWLPEGEPRAVVQLVHGISDYILRYDEFASFLADRGFVVVGSDHLGHGLTAAGPEEYGYLGPKDGWRYLVNDVRALRVKTGGVYSGLRYVLLGHSMGSFVARTYLIQWPGDVDAAILSGTGQEPVPAVWTGKLISGILKGLGRGHTVSPLITTLSLGSYNRNFHPAATESDWISSDPEVVRTYVSDPLCRFVPTVAMFYDMMGGLQFIASQANLRQMDPSTPVLFFSGDADPVGSRGKGVRKVANWFRAAGVQDVTVKLYPGGRHEMLNEVCRRTVYEDVLAWLEQR